VPSSGRKTQDGAQGRAEAEVDGESLARRILSDATATVSTAEFLRGVLGMLLSFVGCDAAELCMRQRTGWLWSRSVRGEGEADGFTMGIRHDGDGCERAFEALRPEPTGQAGNRPAPPGSFLFEDVAESGGPGEGAAPRDYARELCEATDCRSVALLRLAGADEPAGLVAILARRPGGITERHVQRCTSLTDTLGAAVVSQHAFAALRERVKELTCLYEISRVADRPAASLDEVLRGIVELLPPAWQYPEAARARIVLDGRVCSTPGSWEGCARQCADIVVNGDPKGTVEVVYAEPKPELDEGPFLAEERALIDAVAREVALIVERRRADREQAQLREQLIHADRLATIGQLAAGVAHELNEPLGSILGFAQLAQKSSSIPQQASQDMAKIVNVALYMREIIRKLLLFARQMPSIRGRVDLNQVVQNALSFFKARCASSGIALRVHTEPALPQIVGDAAQLNQVVVNLVVNAVQAMPDGGELTVETRAADDHVLLSVRDIGTGMTEEVRKQAFLPFFTTKDVGEGTGLGLPVVHGIVGAHGGRIRFESRAGHGSLFEVRLPLGGAQDAAEGG